MVIGIELHIDTFIYIYSSHIERWMLRWFKYGLNANFTDVNPRFNLRAPAGWTEKVKPQTTRL